MKIGIMGWRALMICAALVPIPAWADLYSAAAASEKQDFAKAFELYRELAEMGQPDAQETLAVMYVNGEGVKRDNVLGYGWAAIAMENGGGEAAKGIVAQLEAHLTDAARVRVAELKSRFGREALEKSLIPSVRTKPAEPNGPSCPMQSAVDPDRFYPPDARLREISGVVVMEYVVYGDGRAHNPRAWYSFPPQVFIAAGRNVSMGNKARPAVENGIAVPCTIRIKVKFSILDKQWRVLAAKKDVEEIRLKAEGGDPRSQLTYAMIVDGRPDLVDKEESALRWYLRSAQAGLPSAQYALGAQALNGFGAERDERKGLAWLDKAAGAGSPEAQLELANYILRESSDAKAIAAAQSLLMRAVEGGSRDAQFYLAAVWATAPEAALRDPARALELIGKAMADFESNPIAFEIRAAARAHSGDFKAAQKDQSTAVSKAKKLGWNTAPLEVRLAGYQSSKSWSGDLFAFY